jgi:hypothetical protein
MAVEVQQFGDGCCNDEKGILERKSAKMSNIEGGLTHIECYEGTHIPSSKLSVYGQYLRPLASE